MSPSSVEGCWRRSVEGRLAQNRKSWLRRRRRRTFVFEFFEDYLGTTGKRREKGKGQPEGNHHAHNVSSVLGLFSGLDNLPLRNRPCNDEVFQLALKGTREGGCPTTSATTGAFLSSCGAYLCIEARTRSSRSRDMVRDLCQGTSSL